MLNKQKGNMYPFVTHTWNPIKGKCPHDCSYCYMKRFPQGELRLDEKCFKDNLGESNFIFVGSSTDMFADKIPFKWIMRVLNYCNEYPKNTYLFQTKNPKRFSEFYGEYPPNTIWGITLETDNPTVCLSKAPDPEDRIFWIKDWPEKMVSIEPIMDFNLEKFVNMIKEIKPNFVSIGADSKKNYLPEPSATKILALIKELEKFTKERTCPV